MKTRTKKVSKYYPVLCQRWEESERGWGVRPDGYSLHLSEMDIYAFIEEYWAGMPDEVPYEYSRPSGGPYACEVDEKTYKKVVNSKNGYRSYDENVFLKRVKAKEGEKTVSDPTDI